MATENGVLINTAEVKQVVANADVFAIGFPLFPERLLVDTRSDATTPPMARLVEPVSSVQERFFWLGQHRPSLGMPQRFMFFFWPHSVGFLEESGVWNAIRQRLLANEAGQSAVEELDRTLDELKAKERDMYVGAIVGDERHRTLWSAR
jgi:hypothetical protein